MKTLMDITKYYLINTKSNGGFVMDYLITLHII